MLLRHQSSLQALQAQALQAQALQTRAALQAQALQTRAQTIEPVTTSTGTWAQMSENSDSRFHSPSGDTPEGRSPNGHSHEDHSLENDSALSIVSLPRTNSFDTQLILDQDQVSISQAYGDSSNNQVRLAVVIGISVTFASLAGLLTLFH